MRRSLLFLLGLVVLSLCGCGGIQGDNGTLTFELVDAPSHVTSFEVMIRRIDVMISGEWEALAFPNRSYDVLQLRFDPEVIGRAGLAAGVYTDIRVRITAARVTDGNGVHDVAIPDAIKDDGLVIPVTFEMESARGTTLLLDFNVAQSLKILPDGSYELDPVIPTVVKHESGTVSGFASRGFGLAASAASVKATYMSGPHFAPGTVVNTTMTDVDGAFRVWALLPGEYRLRLEWNDTFGGFADATVNGVMVTEDNDTNLGNVILD